MPDQKEPLLEASVRQPRNKVARMILADLDSAYNFMYNTPKGGKNRLTPAAVQLFKSRVALFEGTWEKNFAGTAFVPNGEGWTGQATHPSYPYNNSEEVQYFLEEAIKSAKKVADNYLLAENPSSYDYTKNDGSNNPTSDYFEMFGTINQGLDADKFKEVLLYRAYSTGQQLDADADRYRKAIRKRANINEDYTITTAHTNMTEESKNDLGAYTAGNLIDAQKFNIRRERRCEFIAEGMRMDDLLRWRSLDQLTTTKFMPKGFNLWSNFYLRYTPYSESSANPEIDEATETKTGSVSAKNDPYADNKYLIPFRLNLTANNLYKEGVSWHPAHYLYPIASAHFLDATLSEGSSENVENSAIYQNPGWEKTANTTPGNVGGF